MRGEFRKTEKEIKRKVEQEKRGRQRREAEKKCVCLSGFLGREK